MTSVAFASSGTSASHFGGVHSLGCLSIAALVPFVPSYLVLWLFVHVVGLIGIWLTILVGLGVVLAGRRRILAILDPSLPFT